MKRLISSVMIIMALSLTACQTMKGLGEDISNAGKAITKSASE